MFFPIVPSDQSWDAVYYSAVYELGRSSGFHIFNQKCCSLFSGRWIIVILLYPPGFREIENARLYASLKIVPAFARLLSLFFFFLWLFHCRQFQALLLQLCRMLNYIKQTREKEKWPPSQIIYSRHECRFCSRRIKILAFSLWDLRSFYLCLILLVGISYYPIFISFSLLRPTSL